MIKEYTTGEYSSITGIPLRTLQRRISDKKVDELVKMGVKSVKMVNNINIVKADEEIGKKYFSEKDKIDLEVS